MSHICKMTGLESVLPCAVTDCAAHADCTAAHEKSAQGFLLEQPTKTNLDRFREMTAEQLSEWIMCPYTMNPNLCRGKECLKCCSDFLNSPYEGFDL